MSKAAAKKIRDDIAARFCYASGLFDNRREISCNMEHPAVKDAYVAADLLLESYDIRRWPAPPLEQSKP